MTFNKDHALTLAAEAEEDERNATPGNWHACVWDPMDKPHVILASHKGVCRSSNDLPFTAGDATFIANARNRNPHVASMLRAAVARVEELEKERDNWRDHCQGISDLFDPLHHNVTPHSALIVARAAKDAHLQVRDDRDSLRAKLSSAEIWLEVSRVNNRSITAENDTLRAKLAEARAFIDKQQCDIADYSRKLAEASTLDYAPLADQLAAQLQAAEHRASQAEAALGEMTKAYDELGEELERIVGSDGTSMERLRRLEEQANAASSVVAGDWVAMKQLRATLAAALKAKEEACDIADRLADLIANNNPYADKLARIARITELRSVGKEKP
jgi:chromosome segregation ATPase